jgi:hypothetical protein
MGQKDGQGAPLYVADETTRVYGTTATATRTDASVLSASHYCRSEKPSGQGKLCVVLK